ncbi:unnamed protein product [Meganyctiphanes norvegica]|uniref:Cyclic AMP-dependent transcription factor ATF-2 n=1 Tax=Meganyctiphanes norvegica TaxID=48144 RepID=A0AAV2R203_MEGNR
MGEVDKPFSCPQPGCGMSFTNEDHLTVHRRRHEMMHLTVPGDHHTSSLVKHSGFIIDQTPTPTRFLRQCEEVGLFQDLNPFDEQFRRASLSRSTHSINESLEVGTGGSLDTPRILPLADSDETISSTSRDDLNLSVAHAAGSISTSHYYTTTHRHTTRPQTSIRISSPGCEADVEGGEQLRLNVSSAAEAAAANTTSVISTPTPVITAGPSVTHSLDVQLSGDKLSGSYQIPLHHSQTNTLCTSPSNVPPSPSATVLQLLLRLPNGQAIPVEIPATPVANKNHSGSVVASLSEPAPTVNSNAISTNPNNATGAMTNIFASGDHQVPQQPSLAKMKLKAALASSNTAARPGASRNSRANTADRIAEMTMKKRDIAEMLSSDEDDNDESCDSMSASSQSTCTMVSAIGPDGQRIERRRRHSSADDDPAEKRRKFLERNRAAAIRCREKKKKWIETLACKSDELGYINQKLQTEVGTLRAEVAALKSMLLQHKDCPVTLAMQGECKNEADSVAQFHTVVNPSISQANSYSNSSSSPPGLGHKTRTRSLSMPSIPSSASSPVAPLTLNPITYPNTNNTVHYAISNASSSSTVSSTTKVVSISSNITPMNLSNSMCSTQQPIMHAGTITHTAPVSIMKMSPARVASPKSSGAYHMMAGSPGMTQLGEVTILGSGELMSSDGQSRVIQDGTSNIFVATRSPTFQQISQQQHSNATNIILPAHSPASIPTRTANVMLAAHSPNNNIHLSSATKETHVPQLLNLSINNNKHSSAILRKKH